jgi:hypothetical protein
MAQALPQASQARPRQALAGRVREQGAQARRLAALREREQEQVAEAAPLQEFWEQQPAPFFRKAQGLAPWRAPAAREQEPVAAREIAGPAPEELALVLFLCSSSR